MIIYHVPIGSNVRMTKLRDNKFWRSACPTELGVRTEGLSTIERVHVNGNLIILLHEGITKHINIRRVLSNCWPFHIPLWRQFLAWIVFEVFTFYLWSFFSTSHLSELKVEFFWVQFLFVYYKVAVAVAVALTVGVAVVVMVERAVAVEVAVSVARVVARAVAVVWVVRRAVARAGATAVMVVVVVTVVRVVARVVARAVVVAVMVTVVVVVAVVVAVTVAVWRLQW
jgi:hypothetical protein